MSRASRRSLRQVFAVPALIALASVTGLVGALVADGVWDTLASLCLAVPAAIFCAYVAYPLSFRARR
jgi:hypothetical protein